jgi:hypothetical protein
VKKIRSFLLPEDMLREKKLKQYFICILIFAFGIRILLFLITFMNNHDGFLLPDSLGYLQIAENISENGNYSMSESAPYYPDFFRTPLYPAFLFLFRDAGIPIMILLQVLTGVITCWISMIIAFQLRRENTKVFLLAGLFIAVDIPSIVMGNLIMTETFFTFFLSISILAFIYWLKNRHKKQLLLSSTFLGLAVLTRPILLFLPAIMILYFIYLCKKSIRQFLATYFLFLIPFIILTGSWALRNYLVHDHIFYSYIGNFNLLYFQAADIYAKEKSIDINSARNELFNSIKDEMDETPFDDPHTFYKKMNHKSFSIILDNPVSALKNMARANFHLFFRPMRENIDHVIGAKPIYHFEKDYADTELVQDLLSSKNPVFTQILVGFQYFFNLILYIGFAFGIFVIRKNKAIVFWFLILVILYFCLVCSGPEAEARFRVPLIPVLSVISASGWYSLLMKKRAV